MRFYVYELIDPRSDRVFYVGKGCSKRAWAHEINAKRGADGAKSDFIREILNDGQSILVRIVKRFRDEDAAYRFEVERIAKHGAENLFNLTAGGRAPSWVKPDPQGAADRMLVGTWAQFWRKTAGFTLPRRFYYCGKWHAVPVALYAVIKAKMRELIARRGQEWVSARLVQNKA